MHNNQTHILLFDGVCNLCSRIVQFTIKRDHKGKIKFAALQSKTGQEELKRLGLPTQDFDTLVFIKNDKYFLKSSGVLNVLKTIGGFWTLFYIFMIIPAPLRDFAYNIIAKTRYKIFGKKANCMIPTKEIKNRFLE